MGNVRKPEILNPAPTMVLMYGYGALTMIALSFAPEQWLTSDEIGQTWMNRIRVQGENQIKSFRVMTTAIGSFALLWSLLTVIVTMGVMWEL
ncbi:hypothetical protein Pan153_19330 [Gimesia panareensis]|uniref:Uncharacterized protein n=1 Tax=Gimesia panareensis TaxID=2527978 RepID=A0A518FLR3_9PLAN|nr:hypothetical protein [Gimesia panareensis]QDV17298.1 hypothetical protein Pan153_19330 [Gimesia panareensis]